jgi:hypothetical protein
MLEAGTEVAAAAACAAWAPTNWVAARCTDGLAVTFAAPWMRLCECAPRANAASCMGNRPTAAATAIDQPLRHEIMTHRVLLTASID